MYNADSLQEAFAGEEGSAYIDMTSQVRIKDAMKSMSQPSGHKNNAYTKHTVSNSRIVDLPTEKFVNIKRIVSRETIVGLFT